MASNNYLKIFEGIKTGSLKTAFSLIPTVIKCLEFCNRVA
jgi:hypothetical protein